MIIDKENLYHEDTALPDNTTVGGLVIDHGAGAATSGPVNADFTVICQITETATGGATSIQAVLEQDIDEDFSGSEVEVIAGPVVLTADAVAGKVLLFVRQPEITQRYSRVELRGLVSTFTLGKASAWIGSSFQRGEPTE